MTTVAITGPNYFSQNANGTHSIMLKSAFRVFITMVDGEPRIGFFKDCSDSAPIGVSQVFRKEFAIISREANEKFQGDSFVFRFAGTFGRRTVFPCLETVRVRPGAGAGGARGAGGLPVDRRRGHLVPRRPAAGGRALRGACPARFAFDLHGAAYDRGLELCRVESRLQYFRHDAHERGPLALGHGGHQAFARRRSRHESRFP